MSRAASAGIVNAHRINQGVMPELTLIDSGDFYFVEAADVEKGVRKLLTIVQERLGVGPAPVHGLRGLHALELSSLPFDHAVIERAEHKSLLPRRIEAQTDERCPVEFLSSILTLHRTMHPDGRA